MAALTASVQVVSRSRFPVLIVIPAGAAWLLMALVVAAVLEIVR